MSNIVYNEMMNWVPSIRKQTASGWLAFNGVCCTHNGETPDTRKRCSIIIAGDGAVLVSCFNCKFRTIWKPGQMLSRKFTNFLSWMGMPDEQIKKLNFRVWQIHETAKVDESYVPREYVKLDFKEESLPTGAMPISHWLSQGCQDPNFLISLNYLIDRSEEILLGYDYYWTPNSENQMNQRIIIPFKWKGKIVGWTGRSTVGSKHRYYSSVQTNYMFNNEVAEKDWKYILLCEGPFDGIAINGMATLGDKITPDQVRWLNHTGKQIIVVPDREKRGGVLVDTAIDNGWAVTFPSWDQDIKDAAEAVKRYGKLYTVWSIIESMTNNVLEINVKRQRFR